MLRNADREKPMYLRIRDELRQRIVAGDIAVGSTLPPSRQLANDLKVSRITVTNAYDELKAEGLIDGKVGSGMFVLPAQYWLSTMTKGRKTVIESYSAWQQNLSAIEITRREKSLSMILPQSTIPVSLNFGVGTGDTSLFPIVDVRKIVSEILDKGDATALNYEAYQGFLPLRQVLTRYLRQQSIIVDAEEIYITAGSQQAVQLVIEALLKPGDCAIVENPTYSIVLSLFESRGIKVIGIPMDNEGMKDDLLEAEIQKKSPKLIYTVPTFHNPTGTVMSPMRRSRISALANRYGVPVLEDDYIRELRFFNPIPPPIAAWDKHGDIIYVGSFSKSLFPAIRLGYIVARGPIQNRLLYLKRVSDLGSSALLQRIMYHFLESGKLQKHWRRLSRIHNRRQAAMIRALRNHFPAGSSWQSNDGGLWLWIRVPPKVSVATLLESCIRSGVYFSPGETHFVEPNDQPYIRLNFAALDEKQIENGISIIGSLIHEQLNSGLQAKTT